MFGAAFRENDAGDDAGEKPREGDRDKSDG
jgi:hypothetical protein